MVKLNTITTKTGDTGTTGLVGGTRVGKDNPRILAIGEVEEAGAALGVASLFVSPSFLPLIRRIQNDLFDMGADLATPDMAQEGALRIAPAQVSWLETEQERLNADLAPLTSFVLPGGSQSAAHLHVARASVRRAERAIVALHHTDSVNPSLLCYINRLSDFLFVLARAENKNGADDILWVPGQSRD